MISVLSVNFHSALDLSSLTDSLLQHADGEPFELIVVNNSPVESLELSDAVRDRTRILNRPNVGYARGVNAAAAEAGGDILFVANPDVRITHGALAGAREHLQRHPDVAVLLPLLKDGNGGTQASVRRFYTWRAAAYARLPLRNRIPDPQFFREYLMTDQRPSAPAPVDWGLGGAMFLRRDDYPEGRIFDERFFLYFEDVDLCLRVWQSGRTVVYHPGIVCEHRHRRASARTFSRAGLHHLGGLVKFIFKHHGLPQRPKPRHLPRSEAQRSAASRANDS